MFIYEYMAKFKNAPCSKTIDELTTLYTGAHGLSYTLDEAINTLKDRLWSEGIHEDEVYFEITVHNMDTPKDWHPLDPDHDDIKYVLENIDKYCYKSIYTYDSKTLKCIASQHHFLGINDYPVFNCTYELFNWYDSFSTKDILKDISTGEIYHIIPSFTEMKAATIHELFKFNFYDYEPELYLYTTNPEEYIRTREYWKFQKV